MFMMITYKSFFLFVKKWAPVPVSLFFRVNGETAGVTVLNILNTDCKMWMHISVWLYKNKENDNEFPCGLYHHVGMNNLWICNGKKTLACLRLQITFFCNETPLFLVLFSIPLILSHSYPSSLQCSWEVELVWPSLMSLAFAWLCISLPSLLQLHPTF